MKKFFQWKTLLLIFAALLGISVSFHIYLFLSFKEQTENVVSPESLQLKEIQKRNIETAAAYLKEKESVFKSILENPLQIFDPS